MLVNEALSLEAARPQKSFKNRTVSFRQTEMALASS